MDLLQEKERSAEESQVLLTRLNEQNERLSQELAVAHTQQEHTQGQGGSGDDDDL